MRSLLTWSRLELRRLVPACDGNVALMFGLTLPILIGLAGMGIDSAAFYNQQSRMQSVADASALAVAKEMRLYLENPDALKEAGEARVEARLVEAGIADRTHTAEVRIDPKGGVAQVEISMVAKAFLPAEMWGENPIVVTSTARTYGQVKLCVLGLRTTGKDAIKIEDGAFVTAPACGVQSNSSDPHGLVSKDSSILTSAAACTSGGYEGSFVPTPQTDCPTLPDPLELRAPPAVGGCDFLDFRSEKTADSIRPGHYCGGLKIEKNANVVAEPGIYIISGGKFEVGNDAILTGEYVSFYFADDEATLDFKDKAEVELSAPKDGPMAGILFFEDRAAKQGRNFEISSGSVRKLLGTIYLPKGVFKGDDKGKEGPAEAIGEASAYTIIVANRIDLKGVNLVINADYASSDIPVPAGIGPNSTEVRLSN
jgi:Flp pilus assembly protein TadG